MKLTEIWRHPIKGHGREPVEGAEIAVGGMIPGDRRWAVAHTEAKLRDGAWVPCVNFLRGAKNPALMAITARSDAGFVTLSHPDLPDLRFDPDDDSRPFLDWIAPLLDPRRAAPMAVVRAAGQGFSDTPFASISLGSQASHAAVEDSIGRELGHLRWRANLWIEGAPAWAEFDWVGREVSLGTARFRVAERIKRCRATMADPATGRIDADTLGLLETNWGHRDFGVYLICIAQGRFGLGDTLTLH